MKIIILGAGQVGGTLAEHLARENIDITLVDTRVDCLRDLKDRLDLRTVIGFGSYPDILKQAGADDADMLIAVTDSDETNMTACQIAHALFGVVTKIARIRAPQYHATPELFAPHNIPVDVLISPERLVTKAIRRLIEYPGALQVLDFADGLVRLVAVKAYYGGPLVGNAIRTLKEHMPQVDTRVAAIFRQDKPILPQGDTVIEADDEIFFIAAREHIRDVMGELQRLEEPYKHILIAGGGHIGLGLAKRLEANYKVKLIERNVQRAHDIAAELHSTIVLHGDASDSNLLSNEHIEDVDAFIAVTNDDEANIMSAMLAKRLGVRKTMVLINRSAYVDLVQGQTIDIAISPQQITISHLLSHIRRGDVPTVYSLRRGAAEALETVAHGTRKTSHVVGRKIADIKLPPGVNIGALVRGGEVLIAHDHIVIETNDHVILFLIDKQYIPEVETLFQEIQKR